MLRKLVLVALFAANVSACTVNVNTPDSSDNPTQGSDSEETFSTPSIEGIKDIEEKIPTAGLIEFFDFSSLPPSDTSMAMGVTQTTDRLGKSNKAWHFRGGDSFFRVNRNINGEVLPKITMSAWVRSTSSESVESGHIISHDNANTSRILLLSKKETGTHWAAATGPTTGLTKTAEIVKDTWQHLTVSYDDPAGEVNFYVNGEIVDNTTEVAPRSGYDYFYVGSSPFSGKFFEGDIDDVRIYDRVLSADEVGSLYRVSKVK